MTKEMYGAEVKNWLMDLATGAKAAQREVQFDEAPDRFSEYVVTASSYDNFKDGVAVHNLKRLAESIGEPVKFTYFKKGDYLYKTYDGYYYIDMFGVRFYDYANKEKTHERK